MRSDSRARAPKLRTWSYSLGVACVGVQPWSATFQALPSLRPTPGGRGQARSSQATSVVVPPWNRRAGNQGTQGSFRNPDRRVAQSSLQRSRGAHGRNGGGSLPPFASLCRVLPGIWQRGPPTARTSGPSSLRLSHPAPS